MKKNGFAPIIIILVIAILGVVGYFAYKDYLIKPQNLVVPSPSLSTVSESTENWKTYSDIKYGYSLQYPNDWLSTDAKIYPKPKCPEVKTFENKDCTDGYVKFNIYKITSGQTLEMFIKNLDSLRKMDEPQIYDKKNMPNNLVALEAIEANYMGMYGPLIAYIPKKENIIEVYFYNIDSDTTKLILSTFKFTQTAPTVLKDSSLEAYLKNKLNACIQYQGENLCDPNKNEATIQKIDGDYAFGGFGNGQVGLWFGAAKVNGKWSYFIDGNGIPDCSEVEIFPPTSLNSQFDVCSKGSTATIYRSTGKTLSEQKLSTSLVSGDNGALMQFAYSENQLQIYSPQCEPGKNNQGLNEYECVYLLQTNPIILFVSYYKDGRFNQLEDYKNYLVQKNLAKNIKTTSIGNVNNPISALVYTPLNPDKERKGVFQEYALMKNGSLFLIDLIDNTSTQALNKVVSTIEFIK